MTLPDKGPHFYHWRGDSFELPAGGELFATGLMFSIERFSVNEKGWRMQFHPEVIGAIRQRWVETAVRETGE